MICCTILIQAQNLVNSLQSVEGWIGLQGQCSVLIGYGMDIKIMPLVGPYQAYVKASVHGQLGVHKFVLSSLFLRY